MSLFSNGDFKCFDSPELELKNLLLNPLVFLLDFSAPQVHDQHSQLPVYRYTVQRWKMLNPIALSVKTTAEVAPTDDILNPAAAAVFVGSSFFLYIDRSRVPPFHLTSSIDPTGHQYHHQHPLFFLLPITLSNPPSLSSPLFLTLLQAETKNLLLIGEGRRERGRNLEARREAPGADSRRRTPFGDC